MTNQLRMKLYDEAHAKANAQVEYAAATAADKGAGAHFEIGYLQQALGIAFYELAILRQDVEDSCEAMQALLEKLKD